MTKSYTSKDIRILGDIGAIRVNSNQFVGSTERPTHLVEEAIDNAIDEALGGFANVIAVNIDTKTRFCSVLDNGRGIPITDDVPKTISTKLHSGAKFHDNKTAYKISSGMHGVGLVAINALSDVYTIEVYRDNKHATFNFVGSKLGRKKIVDYIGDIPYSTKIEFKPSMKIFDNLIPDLDRIRKRLTTASAEIPDCKFILNINKKTEMFDLTLEEHFKNQCLNSDNNTALIYLTSLKKPELFNILLTYSLGGSITPKIISSVNLLPVDNGGTHVNIFYELIRDFFVPKAKKYGYKFQPNDTLCGLRAYLKLNLIEPKFSSQTKDKLVSKKGAFEFFSKQLKNQLEIYFTNNEEELKEHLERFDFYRKRLDSKKLKSTTNGKRAATKFTKLRDCTSRSGELFIVEGDSAGGSILQCRNPRIHAVFPLKGKIPNVSGAKDILRNKEVSELLKAFGTGVGPDFDIDDLRYDKIICTADADHDGGHITALVTMMLAVLVPEIIKNEYYYIAKAPLFAINEGKIFIPLWTNLDLKKATESGKNITRFKGLGEMNPSQIKVSLIDKKTRLLIPISYSSDISKLEKLFSDSDEKRKLLNL